MLKAADLTAKQLQHAIDVVEGKLGADRAKEAGCVSRCGVAYSGGQLQPQTARRGFLDRPLYTPGNVDETGRVLVLALSEPGLSAEVQDTAADDRKGSRASARSRAHSRDDALARRRRRRL